MHKDRQWRLLEGLCAFFRRLPHRIAVGFGAWLGRLVWFLSKARVDRAEARCVRILGVGPTLARVIVRKSYENHGRSVAEFVRLPQTVGALDDLVTVEGEKHLRRALERGRGVILLSAHLGNWEMAAAWLGFRGYPMNAVGAEQRDPRITDFIVHIRERCGIRGIGKGFDLKMALSCLRRGEILCILLDQDAKSRGMIVPFLGAPASTPYGPVKLASKLGAQIVPIFSIRQREGTHFHIRICPPLPIPQSPLSEHGIKEALVRCNRCLGAEIRRHPEQWMWLYPRWASTLGDR
ncbi:MAG: lipid A biosynthesis acyltransferase [Dethiosulfovibrio peptidovorans]|nr:MAG: lipid A biosynthesis acyltransferase [Dethiosulfovibrio peptidovorans]